MSAGRPLSQPGGRPAHAAAAGLVALAALLGGAQAQARSPFTRRP